MISGALAGNLSLNVSSTSTTHNFPICSSATKAEYRKTTDFHFILSHLIQVLTETEIHNKNYCFSYLKVSRIQKTFSFFCLSFFFFVLKVSVFSQTVFVCHQCSTLFYCQETGNITWNTQNKGLVKVPNKISLTNICKDIQNDLESLPCINSSDKPSTNLKQSNRYTGEYRDSCCNHKYV